MLYAIADGAASTVEGWRFAFGRMEELRTRVLGHAARSLDHPQPLDRLTGVGRVECKRGDYSDAIDKGHGVHLYVLEPSGACDPALTSLLRTISKSVGLPGIQDSTVYGTSRASTRSFYYHHLAATSAAIVQQDALTIVSYAAAESFRLTLSPSPSSALAGSFGGQRA